ncbi:hypothetical protein MHBO_002376 [Bonamia ostreae]|uniref:Uncharacterized protein n=1 Tax=Bonamia ostreae TaxID=126728 RepID=A0ABV2AM86_9EUKA
MSSVEMTEFIEDDCDKVSKRMPFSFNKSKTHIEYSERDKVTAEKIAEVSKSLPFIFQLGEETYCEDSKCFKRKTNMNLCNDSFQKRKFDLIYYDQCRVLKQIIIMSNFLVHASIYLTNEIDYERTVNFDSSGTVVFNLVQCEYVAEPNEETLERHCIFLLRSINTVFFGKMTFIVGDALERIRHSLLEGSYLVGFFIFGPNSDASEFMFCLNLENTFYVFDNTFNPFSMSNIEDKEHLVGPINGKFLIKACVFRKNSPAMFDFMGRNNISFTQKFDDWKFSYILYQKQYIEQRFYLTY